MHSLPSPSAHFQNHKKLHLLTSRDRLQKQKLPRPLTAHQQDRAANEVSIALIAGGCCDQGLSGLWSFCLQASCSASIMAELDVWCCICSSLPCLHCRQGGMTCSLLQKQLRSQSQPSPEVGDSQTVHSTGPDSVTHHFCQAVYVRSDLTCSVYLYRPVPVQNML